MQFSENFDWNSCHLLSTHEVPKLVLAYSPYSIRNHQCVRYFGAQKLSVRSNKAWLNWRIFINLLTSATKRCLAILRFFFTLTQVVTFCDLRSEGTRFAYRSEHLLSCHDCRGSLKPFRYIPLHWPPSFHTLSNLRLSTIQTRQHVVRFTESFSKLTIYFLNPPGRLCRPPSLLFGSFLQVKLPWRNIAHPPPPTAEVKNGWGCRPTPISPSRLHETDRENVLTN